MTTYVDKYLAIGSPDAAKTAKYIVFRAAEVWPTCQIMHDRDTFTYRSSSIPTSFYIYQQAIDTDNEIELDPALVPSLEIQVKPGYIVARYSDEACKALLDHLFNDPVWGPDYMALISDQAPTKATKQVTPKLPPQALPAEAQ